MDMFLENELIFKVLYYTFIVSVSVQLFYYLFFYSRIIFRNTKKNIEIADFPPVSVIIAARNEGANLEKFLPAFLEQDYPDFRVIVVNDASTDDSATVLAFMKQKYDNLYITNIPYDEKFRHGKKTALTIGVKAAETDILVFSDADCEPASNQWLKNIASNFDSKTQFVIGFGAYKKAKGLLNKILRNDTVAIAMNYLNFALAKIPYMAVGRNMAYRKSLFMEKRGFAGHLNVLSGSDDLFVNSNANSKNIKVELSKESFTYSIPKTTYKEWKEQKIRHLTTSKFYKFKHKFLLSLEPFSRILYYVTGVLFLAHSVFLMEIISLFSIRFLFFCVTLYVTNRKLNQKRLFLSGIIFDVIQPLINLFFLIFAKTRKELLWK